MKKRKGLPKEIVAVTAYVLIFGLLQFFSDNYDPFSSGTGDYSFYRGPVLPMTSLSGGEMLEVRRHVDFDFSGLSTDRTQIVRGQEARITDDYALHNPTIEAVTVTLAYPFEGAAADPLEDIPSIRVNGEEAAAFLAAPADVSRNFNRANSFPEYQTLFSENDYLTQAAVPAPDLNQRVTVYHFADIAHREEAPYVFLRVRFLRPENCTIWAFNWTSGSWDARNGEFDMMFPAEADGTGEGFLLVSGAELPSFDLTGNIGYNEGEQYRTDKVSCHVESYESTLSEMLRLSSGKYDPFEEEGKPLHSLVTPEFLYQGAAKHLSSGSYTGAGTGYISLDSVFYAVSNQKGLCYRIFDVTIPPGETAQVTVRYGKEGSEDNGGLQQHYRYGFDLAADMGSNLCFTALSASVSGWDAIEIQSQNFGFDLPSGITQVTLDPNQDRYYIDVVLKKQEEN